MKFRSIKTLLNRLKSGYVDKEAIQNEGQPTGPMKQRDEGSACSLLIFVPRNPISALINEMTGGYGYSHLAVDCGEIDIPSGKRVMIEATFGLGVHYGFQDEYGERKFVRIPLETAGVNVREFCECIHSKLGEKFDEEEVLTIGLMDDPAKQICSDLATVCLPEEMRTDVARCHRTGLIHSLAAVRPDGDRKKTFRLFISPNGFAEYFGAPRGAELAGRNQLAEPVLPTKRMS